MWEGHLGEVEVKENRSHLIPEVKPFNSEPYQSGPNIRELLQVEVKKKIYAGVCKPAQRE